MSQRNSGYERKERDLYETPEWVTQALRPHIKPSFSKVWEPACGSGKMSRVIASWNIGVVSSDIEPAPLSYEANFLQSALHEGCDGIITNPPYELATEFVEHALKLTDPVCGYVAMLLRTDFDHAKGRSHLFANCPAFERKR